MEDLRVFCMVVNKQSFAASALEMRVSKALISKRIAVLESMLQARLLHRTTRKVSATESGHIAYQWAQRIVEDAEQMAEAISPSKITPRGLLRVCTSSGFGRNHVSRAVSAMAQRYPELEFQLELLDRPVDLVREGFDLDIRIGEVHEESLITKLIARNARVLCASSSYLEQWGTPSRLADLAHHKCIVIRERDQEFGRWKLDGSDGAETVRISGPLSANN